MNEMRMIDADALKKAFEEVYPLATNEIGGVVNKRIYDIIDNAPTVEPEKALVAKVTFDEDKLKEIVHTEVIEKIKSGELVIRSEEIPQGEWINPYLSSTTGEFSAKCNICGEDIIVSSSHRNFCPNCGADMRGDT